MQNKNKFKEGDLVNLRYGTPGEEDKYGCLVVRWWMNSRPYGLPAMPTYQLLLPNGKWAAASEDYLELASGAR